MSVAFDLFPPESPPAPRLRRHLYDAGTGCAPLLTPRPARPATPERFASVSVLRAPSPLAAPLRLTRRGLVVLTLAVVALGVGLVWLAALSAPHAPSTPPADAGAVTVTVRPGDTLWDIASRVAPQRDPRAEIAQLRELNQLPTSALQPGQTLRLR